jgi:DNA replication protein DnaC
MNLIELDRALHQLRLGGMAAVLETRLRQAQVEAMAPIDLISCLVSDELTRRTDRLLERRRKQARFRDPDRTLDNFDFTFNPKMNRSLVFDLATGGFINKREDALFLGPGGTGKSHLAQAIGQAAIQQGYKVLYRETHILLDELAEAVADGSRKQYMESVATVPLLIIDDFGMRKLPHTAAEDLLEIIMRRYERFSTLLTSNRPVEDWANCWAMSLRSAPCSIACCITVTSSSAARVAGALRPLRHHKEEGFLSARASPRAPGI